MNNRTTVSLSEETKSRLYKVRGKLEIEDGKRRTLEDVINELIDLFETSVQREENAPVDVSSR